MKTIQPNKGHVFAKPLEAIKKTTSGILLDEKTAEKPQIAEVVSTGEGADFLKEGEQFTYKAYAATDIKLDGTDYILIAEEDILGKVLEND